MFDPAFAIVHIPTLAVLGACLGSFFNVCIYRIPQGVPLSFPSSHCYRCGQTVRWHDNLPLLSYWLLGGRCRYCGARFSARYFLVELLTMGLLLGAALRLGYTLTIIPAWIFISLLIIGTFTDIDHWIIPDRITLGGIAAGIALAAIPQVAGAPGNPLRVEYGTLLWELFYGVAEMWRPLANSLAGAAAGWGILWGIGVLGTLLFRKDAMGLGDVKLFSMFGAFCGLGNLIPILLLASATGMVIGGIGILRGKLVKGPDPDPAVAPLAAADEGARGALAAHPLNADERHVIAEAIEHPGGVGPLRHHLPFGPSLAIAAYIVYLYGKPLTQWFLGLMPTAEF